MTDLKTHSGWQYWLLGLLFGGLLPWVANASNITVYHKIIWVLLGLNGLYALLSGWFIGREGHDGWHLLIFPVVFAIATYVFRDNAHEYAYYLAIGYACVSFFMSGIHTGFTTDHRPAPKAKAVSKATTTGKLAVGR